MNIKEHVLFPTHIAHNLESESRAGFFFLCILSPILEVFPVQLQCPPYLYNVKVFKICPGMYVILELSMNLHSPNSLELQSSPCTHCLPVIWVFFAGQLSGAKGTKYFFVWNIYHCLKQRKNSSFTLKSKNIVYRFLYEFLVCMRSRNNFDGSRT